MLRAAFSPRVLIVFAWLACAGPAFADLTFEFSEATAQALKGRDAGTRPSEIADLVNARLRRLAPTNPAAADLLASNQTIRIVCFGEEEANAADLIAPPPGFDNMIEPGLGKTRGDFGPDGKPRPNGRALIAIDCNRLRLHGWFQEFRLFTTESMWGTLLHELLHATNAARRHPPDATDIYDQWVKDLGAPTEQELSAARSAARKREREAKRQADGAAGGAATPSGATGGAATPSGGTGGNATPSGTPGGAASPPGEQQSAPPKDTRSSYVPSAPGFNFGVGLGGGLLAQSLPSGSANLGVVNVGNLERPLVNVAHSLVGGFVSAGGAVANVNLPFSERSGLIVLGGSYGRAEEDFGRSVEGEIGVSNGLTYWDRAENDSPGIASLGSGASGRSETTFDTFSLRPGLLFELPCEESEAEGEIAFGRPATFVELAANVGYASQDVRQSFSLSQMDPVYDVFDISSRTNVDIEDWQFGGSFGLFHARPVPGIENLAFGAGARVTLGYRHASADASQSNTCDVEFAASPGVNACPLALQDFRLDFDLDEAGFEYGLGVMARLDYRLDRVLPGLSVGTLYEFGYSGFTRFDAPTNLDAEGPPTLDWVHEPSHRFGVQATFVF